MKLLHTSDWHVGKAVRGRGRAQEHIDVLAEISGIADREGVDLVLVTGDLFDSGAPTPESERIVYRALLDLAATDREVVVLAGNHDNANRLAAVAPVFGSHGVTIVAAPQRADAGGVMRWDDCGGVPVRLAVMPWVSPRYILRVDQLMHTDADQHALTFSDRVQRMLASLSEDTTTDSVNLVAAHLMVWGGQSGGGERVSQTVFDYSVTTAAFPTDAQYVALGHLHRSQRLAAVGQVWYCGSPLQLDFSEDSDDKVVHIVEAVPGEPAVVTPVALSAGRRFRIVRGTLDELRALVDDTGDAFLKVVVTEPARADLADEVRSIFDDPVIITVDAPGPEAHRVDGDRDLDTKTPLDLFASYLQDVGIDDDRMVALFAELVEDLESEASRAT